jgi:hypothetical protein
MGREVVRISLLRLIFDIFPKMRQVLIYLVKPICRTLIFLFAFSIIVFAEPLDDEQLGECTIAVIGRTITNDGRPIIWKNRDISDHDQRFIYYAPYSRDGITTFAFIGNCFRVDTTRIYMGANDRGFAIMNSDSYNLGDSLFSGIDDGTLMRIALESCSTLHDFEMLLDSTNISGRLNCWNFGCLDSTAASALYECANRGYWKFDPDTISDSTSGFIVRANFSMNGINQPTNDGRYNRAVNLLMARSGNSQVDMRYVLSNVCRDMGNIFADPYPLPYNGTQMGGPAGYIYNYGCTIANRSTSSAVAIRGIRQGESTSLTTIFAILGPPVLSVAFPLWVGSGTVPIYLSYPSGAPVYTYCQQRLSRIYDDQNAYFMLNSHSLVDNFGGGIYTYTLPLESWGIFQADCLLNNWDNHPPSQLDMQFEQFRIARAIFTGFQMETAGFVNEISGDGGLPLELALYNYPNPFNDGTNIVFSGLQGGFPVTLHIYDILGRNIMEISGTNDVSGTVYWTGKDMLGNRVPSGIYLYTLVSGPYKKSNKMILLK